MSRPSARWKSASCFIESTFARVARATLIATLAGSPVVACFRDELPLPTNSGGSPIADPSPSSAKRWSDPASWPDQKVPTAGADVIIPKDLDLLLDISPPPLASLRIEGTLTADDRDLEITAGSIHVYGTLAVGSERTPFANRMVLTLTGDDPGTDTP
jgi:cell migration-inducing and hyaluronan-binding protein